VRRARKQIPSNDSFDFVTYTPQDQDKWDEAYADFLKLIG
jgi:hypothetical protein